MCLNEAYLAFLRRISKREYKNFGGFVFTLVLNVVLDVRRQITGSRGPAAEMVNVEDSTALLVDQRRKPPQNVANHELRKIMKEVMVRHAKESPLSANVVLHRSARDWNWKEIAERRVPEEGLGNSLRTRIRAAQVFY